MTKVPKKHLTERYPKSKTIRDALLKRGKLKRKIAVCEHDKIDYKTMNLLAKKSIAVIENLAKAVASLEEQNQSLRHDWNMCDAAADQHLINYRKLKKENDELKEVITNLTKRLEVMRHVN